MPDKEFKRMIFKSSMRSRRIEIKRSMKLGKLHDMREIQE
jgi:hypothetical protein